MSFPRYPIYKDSGIKWLGNIPFHWDTSNLKHVVDQNRRITYGIVQAGSNVEGGIPYIRPADMDNEGGILEPDEILRTSEEISDSYRRSSLKAGDLVCSIGPSFGKLMFVPAWLEGGNLTQGTARVAVAEKNIPQYIFWCLRSKNSFQQWESSVGGATFRALNLGPLADTSIALPPESEQISIASFVSHETAKIDALIAEQQHLIELLKEKRQAVISHAVTKGLNPDAPMKDSGVEWLGKVPEHWVFGALKRFCNITTGFAFKSDDFQEEGTPLLRISDIQIDGSVDLTAAKHVVESELLCHPREIVSAGDIVMAMTGATIGKAGIYNLKEPALLNQRVCAFRAHECSRQDYIWLIVSSKFYQEHVRVTAFGGAQPNISDGELLECICPLPPLEEQELIVKKINIADNRFKALLGEAEIIISLLSERRSGLISSAVTGQIDVRGLVPEVAAA